jgi:hypothetical protein
MSDRTYTVISTAITQEIPEENYTVERIKGPILPRPAYVRTKLKMEIFVDGEVLGYEAEIPTIVMTRRPATDLEALLAFELNEADRRHERRTLGIWE